MIGQVSNKTIEFIPYSNEEAKKWIEAYLGSSLVKIVSRTKYTIRVVVKKEGGIEEESLISLPRYIVELS